MSTHLTVADATAQLHDARKAEAARRVADAQAQLKTIRRQAKTLKAEAETIVPEVKQADTTVTAARSALYRIDQELSQLSSLKNGSLLDDPEDEEREAYIAALHEHRAEVFKKLEAGIAKQGHRMRAIEIQNELNRLEWVVKNLTELIANGGQPKNGWEGGVFRV